jgi:hypothetical protein
MIPGELVLTAIPLNIINAIIVASILNPVTGFKIEATIIALIIFKGIAVNTNSPGII